MKRLFYFEQKSPFPQRLILVHIEAEQRAWPALLAAVAGSSFGEDAEAEEFFAEVTPVDFAAQDGFVEFFQVGEQEIAVEQVEADGFVAEFGAQAAEGVIDDLGVIESEGRQFVAGKPTGVGGVGGGGQFELGGVDEGEVGHRHYPVARVAAGLAEGVKLFQIIDADTGFFLQFPFHGCFQRFVGQNQTAGQGPLPFEGQNIAADEQQLQLLPGITEHDGVDGEVDLRRHGDKDTG